MFKNVASQKWTCLVIDIAANAPKTGDAANLTAYVSKDDGSVTVLGDTSATELDATNAPGLYSFDLTQSETNADKLVFSGKSSTADIRVIPETIYTRANNINDLVIDASGNLTANLTGAVSGSVGSVTGNVGGNVAGAVGSVTGNVGGNVTGSVGSLATQAKADVNAEVLDVMNVDTFAESSSVPAATASIFAKIRWLATLARNKITQTSTTQTLRNDADSGNIATATVSDDGSTATRGEFT